MDTHSHERTNCPVCLRLPMWQWKQLTDDACGRHQVFLAYDDEHDDRCEYRNRVTNPECDTHGDPIALSIKYDIAEYEYHVRDRRDELDEQQEGSYWEDWLEPRPSCDHCGGSHYEWVCPMAEDDWF